MSRERPLIAFFDYPDVFEDFYPHYGVDQSAFATRWVGSGNHAFLSLLQREIGDVLWYAFSLAPTISEKRHELGFRVKFLPSSGLHRWLWRVFYVPSPAWRWRRVYPLYATMASYLALTSWPFVKALRQDRPDVFFVQDYATGRFDMLVLIAWILNARLIAWHSGSRPEWYIGKLAKRWTIPHADCLIVSSQEELEMLADRYKVPRERLRLVLTPIDTIGFRPIDRTVACRQAGLDVRRRYFLFVGRLEDRVKRIGALIRAFAASTAMHGDIDLLIIGDGPDANILRAQAAEQAPNRVRFLGWIVGADSLASFYNAADCLILPSWSEGFPTVVGEALACGTPVLASRVGGISELVIEGRTGWLIRPGDDDALKARLSFITANSEIAASMRPQARKMAEARVSAAVVAGALKECFPNHHLS